jgi:hypothetical protein
LSIVLEKKTRKKPQNIRLNPQIKIITTLSVIAKIIFLETGWRTERNATKKVKKKLNLTKSSGHLAEI